MKKITIVLTLLMVTVIAIPHVAEAAWWNPFSWFRNHTSRPIFAPSVGNPVVVTPKPVPTEPAPKEKEMVIVKEGNSGTLTGKIGESITMKGAKVTITELVEDSRCPIDVQCIQAGTVRVRVRGTYGLLSKNVVLKLGESYKIREYTVTLTDVVPKKVATETASPSDYIFKFTFTTTNE